MKTGRILPSAGILIGLALTMPGCLTVDDDISSQSNEASYEYTSPEEQPSQQQQLPHWIINNAEASDVLQENGAGILVNVQSATEEVVDNMTYARVKTTGIPNYTVTVDQSLLDSLNQRPKISEDFAMGQTTVELFDIIAFGQDIGYNNNVQQNCAQGGGYGYWPPGPECPTNQNKDGYFPQQPTPATEDCETGLGVIGYAINGVSLYNWGDGMSVNNEDIWYSLAPFAEAYDVDICGGHAAMGDYHHHFYTACWGDVAGEDEQGHSDILGYAADGFAVYGPWQDTGILAKSCWVARDYTADSSTDGGCDDNDRSCVLNNPLDITAGTTPVDSSKTSPSLAGSYTSLSGNVFATPSGFFKEDYYFDADCATAASENLDKHNGHDHDSLGYHYHVTISITDNKTPTYPFIVGPNFKGELASNAVTQCGGISAGGAGGPNGPGGSDGNMPPPPRE